MKYTLETTVREIYENHPIGRDLLNALAKLGGKKYGFCGNSIIGGLPLNIIAQMIADLVEIETFNKVLDVLNCNDMKMNVPGKKQETPGWWRQAVFFVCETFTEDSLKKAKMIGADAVIFPCNLFTEELDETIEKVHKLEMKLIPAVNLQSATGKNGQCDLNWREETMRRQIKQRLEQLIKAGADGFCLEEADLLLGYGSKPDLRTDFKKISGIYGRQDVLFAPELETYLRELMEEVIRPHGGVLIGKTEFDGIAVAASRTSGVQQSMNLVLTALDMEGLQTEDPMHVDLNDFKFWIQDRYMDIPFYWPMLGWHTVNGRGMAQAVTEQEEQRKAAARLLAVLSCTLRGTPYIQEKEIAGMEEFWKELLKIRKNYIALRSGEIQMKNETLYDLMTFKRTAEDGSCIFVECNLSSNNGIVPCNRPDQAQLLLSNYKEISQILRPYEVNLYQINN